MAGKRSESGRPLKRVASADRRDAQFEAELAAAETLADRVIAAADHVRAELAARPNAEVADEVVDFLRGAVARIRGGRVAA